MHRPARNRGFRLFAFDVDAGGHDRNPQHAFHIDVERGTHNDIRIRVDLVADDVRGLVQFEQGKIITASDVDQNTFCAVQRDFIQQRVGNRLLCRLNSTVSTGRLTGAHHRLAHLVHHRAHVGEVEVDQAGAHHQIGHTLNPLIQNVIGHGEGFGKRGAFVSEPEQVLVRDHDQRVDHLLQRLDAFFGLTHPLVTFELEGFGDHAHSQHTQFACGLRDDWRGPGASAATHPGGDKAHMRASQMIDNLLDRFLGGRSPDRGSRPGTKTLGDLQTHLDLVGRTALLQRLRIGVGDDEFDALKVLVDHVVDRVAPGTTDAENRDARLQFVALRIDHQIQCHFTSRRFLL